MTSNAVTRVKKPVILRRRAANHPAKNKQIHGIVFDHPSMPKILTVASVTDKSKASETPNNNNNPQRLPSPPALIHSPSGHTPPALRHPPVCGPNASQPLYHAEQVTHVSDQPRSSAEHPEALAHPHIMFAGPQPPSTTHHASPSAPATVAEKSSSAIQFCEGAVSRPPNRTQCRGNVPPEGYTPGGNSPGGHASRSITSGHFPRGEVYPTTTILHFGPPPAFTHPQHHEHRFHLPHHHDHPSPGVPVVPPRSKAQRTMSYPMSSGERLEQGTGPRTAGTAAGKRAMSYPIDQRGLAQFQDALGFRGPAAKRSMSYPGEQRARVYSEQERFVVAASIPNMVTPGIQMNGQTHSQHLRKPPHCRPLSTTNAQPHPYSAPRVGTVPSIDLNNLKYQHQLGEPSHRQPSSTAANTQPQHVVQPSAQFHPPQPQATTYQATAADTSLESYRGHPNALRASNAVQLQECHLPMGANMDTSVHPMSWCSPADQYVHGAVHPSVRAQLAQKIVERRKSTGELRHPPTDYHEATRETHDAVPPMTSQVEFAGQDRVRERSHSHHALRMHTPSPVLVKTSQGRCTGSSEVHGVAGNRRRRDFDAEIFYRELLHQTIVENQPSIVSSSTTSSPTCSLTSSYDVKVNDATRHDVRSHDVTTHDVKAGDVRSSPDQLPQERANKFTRRKKFRRSQPHEVYVISDSDDEEIKIKDGASPSGELEDGKGDASPPGVWEDGPCEVFIVPESPPKSEVIKIDENARESPESHGRNQSVLHAFSDKREGNAGKSHDSERDLWRNRGSFVERAAQNLKALIKTLKENSVTCERLGLVTSTEEIFRKTGDLELLDKFDNRVHSDEQKTRDYSPAGLVKREFGNFECKSSVERFSSDVQNNNANSEEHKILCVPNPVPFAVKCTTDCRVTVSPEHRNVVEQSTIKHERKPCGQPMRSGYCTAFKNDKYTVAEADVDDDNLAKADSPRQIHSPEPESKSIFSTDNLAKMRDHVKSIKPELMKKENESIIPDDSTAYVRETAAAQTSSCATCMDTKFALKVIHDKLFQRSDIGDCGSMPTHCPSCDCLSMLGKRRDQLGAPAKPGNKPTGIVVGIKKTSDVCEPLKPNTAGATTGTEERTGDKDRTKWVFGDFEGKNGTQVEKDPGLLQFNVVEQDSGLDKDVKFTQQSTYKKTTSQQWESFSMKLEQSDKQRRQCDHDKTAAHARQISRNVSFRKWRAVDEQGTGSPRPGVSEKGDVLSPSRLGFSKLEIKVEDVDEWLGEDVDHVSKMSCHGNEASKCGQFGERDVKEETGVFGDNKEFVKQLDDLDLETCVCEDAIIEAEKVNTQTRESCEDLICVIPTATNMDVVMVKATRENCEDVVNVTASVATKTRPTKLPKPASNDEVKSINSAAGKSLNEQVQTQQRSPVDFWKDILGGRIDQIRESIEFEQAPWKNKNKKKVMEKLEHQLEELKRCSPVEGTAFLARKQQFFQTVHGQYELMKTVSKQRKSPQSGGQSHKTAAKEERPKKKVLQQIKDNYEMKEKCEKRKEREENATKKKIGKNGKLTKRKNLEAGSS